MTPLQDYVNGVFELVGGFILLLNCYRLYVDKQIKGVSVSVVAFFTLWGYWNLYYYPSLNQWCSFFGGVLIVIANTLWVSMAIYYRKKRNED